MFSRLKEWLAEPALKNLEVDSLAFSLTHREVLLRKKMVRDLFRYFYEECRAMDRLHFGNCPGKRVDLGSGSSLIDQFFPDMITSDIKKLPFVDCVLDATTMPFGDNTLRAIYAVNVFHHLPDPRIFFREAIRTLHPGGGLVLIEPFYGPAARLLFRHLHATEGFDPEAGWTNSRQSGPFANANQALSYIIFRRDLELFSREFPELELLATRPHTHLRYLLSGGLNFRQLVPDSLSWTAKLGEYVFKPLDHWLCLQHTIVLRKHTQANS